VVTLTGVGGVGKTALAVEAAWIEASAGRAVLACYIDLVPCRTDEQVVAALVEGVGIRGAAAAAGLDAVGASGWPARASGSGRHDSLDACLAWSHALLPADAAVVFRRLSVFPGGFDLAAALQVAGTRPVEAGRVGALVEQLVTASLLEADTSGARTRFRFHEPVRQYAAARLAEAGEEDLARWGHARAFLARAEAIEPMLFAPRAEEQCDLLRRTF
jgi:predicted ATPase